MPKTPLISIQDLCIDFRLNAKQTLHAVSHVSLDIAQGETVGLVGESGCGKTTLGRAVKGMYPPASGRVLFENHDVFALSGKQRMAYLKDSQMIFQDPYSSLDPRMTVREIIGEGMKAHRMGDANTRTQRVDELLSIVGLSPEHANRFPHEFSGGQRQRIGVARALALNPRFIICDEPTSALDVSIQAQIVTLLADLQQRLGLTYLFISHDLAMVKYISNRVAVMYLGEIVEIAPSHRLYDAPQHPYTRSLLSAIQVPDPILESQRQRIRLQGDVPNPINVSPIGCKFRGRCPYAQPACAEKTYALTQVAEGHYTACTCGNEGG